MYLRSRSLTALLSIATVLLGGCLDRPLRPLNPCTVSGVVNEVAVTEINEIDLLFLVDNSASMREEQQALITEIPRLVEILASGDLQDGGTTDDFDPVASIQVGIITSNMGIGGVDIPASAFCTTTLGDDGILVDLHRGTNASCPTEPAVPAFLTFMSSTDDPATFAASVGCLADTGSQGCAFEQQLEAVLKALTPADSSIKFPQRRNGVEIRRTDGHGGAGANSGFLRANSLLAIIMVTDEDDCSTDDLDLYEITTTNTAYPVPRDNASPPNLAPNRQCAAHRDAQYNVMTRYVDGILALRPGAENLTIFATISGVDPDVLDANSEDVVENGITLRTTDIDAILADPTMMERSNAAGNDLVPSCIRPNPAMPMNTSLENRAFPPRRLLTVTRGLVAAGVGGVVASICQAVDPDNGDYTADFGPAVRSIAARIAASLPTSCLPRPLIRGGTGAVTCQILEVLPEGVTCAEQASRGRQAEAVRMDGTREVCLVNQVIPTAEQIAGDMEPTELGWFYDDYLPSLDEDCQRFEVGNRQQVRFTTGAESVPGAKFRLECLSPVVPTGARADIGSPCPGFTQADCDLAGDDLISLRSQYDRANAALVCDDFSNTCQLGCATDADCPGGYVCFDAAEGNMGMNSYCISPTCQL
ncbi:MAG: hypothetical protein KC593_00670 [Myxococcales bacterium]|nr:hypothetical protein [Myxococcales bacterium]MCB9628649.1 hypothetical protein [Sandaracinaceae bacterium]